MQGNNNRRCLEVIQDSGGCYHLVFLPANEEIGRFVTSRNATAGQRARLIESLTRLFEKHLEEVFQR